MELKSLIVFLVALFLSVIVIRLMIPILYKFKFGQNIFELAPEKHKLKQGIPTMGGLGFISVIVIVSFIFLGTSPTVLKINLTMVLFAIFGFIDDSFKLFLKRNLGLKAKQKLVIQIIISIFVAYIFRDYASNLIVPFFGSTINLGFLYYPFTVLFLVALTNSTNLTDGVDGLLGSVSIVTVSFLTVITLYSKEFDGFNLSLIYIGSLLGYLFYNKYPAKIMMGDTGSMAVGGFIGAFLMSTGTTLFIFFIGIIYILESLSVILQVWSFQTRGKRIFKMSPIHHHFELSGYSENKIVLMFSAVTLLMVVISIGAYIL